MASPEQPKKAPHYHGHRGRLRDRFRATGGDALPDYELLELVLFSAQPRGDMKPLAKALIDKFGSFAEVMHAPDARLAEVDGVGTEIITEIRLVATSASRIMHGELKQRPML